MNLTASRGLALVLASILWGVETWLLVDAAGYTLTPQVAVIPAATAALAFLPLILKEATAGLRVAITLSCLFLAAFVFQAVLERTGGALDTKVAAAERTSEGRHLLEAELGRERGRLADAEDNMKAESKRGGCGPTCKTWQSAAVGIQARIDALVAELANQAPPPVADPVSRRVADMVPVFSEATIRNWRPTFQPFGFLVAIWALFGFACAGRVSETVSDPKTLNEPVAGGGGRGLRVVPKFDHEIEAVRTVLHSRGAVSNDELAALMSVSKGEASKRVERTMSLGVVSKRRVGRHVAISLEHAH